MSPRAERPVSAVRKVYHGGDIQVSFDLDICVHIGECLRGHHGVFRLERRPWVLPDEADADTVAEIIERCPSGALQYRRLDGGAPEEHQGTQVTPIRNGPLLVTGVIEVRREDGTIETLPRDPVPVRVLQAQALLRQRTPGDGVSRAGHAVQDPHQPGAPEARRAHQQVRGPAQVDLS